MLILLIRTYPHFFRVIIWNAGNMDLQEIQKGII